MNNDFRILYDFIDRQLREVLARQEWMVRKIGELQNHVTCLHSSKWTLDDVLPVSGHLALQQQACLRLATIVANDFQQQGIKYFLSAGSLLGAMRTGGFIPWDDDVDFGLLRPDFERAVDFLTDNYNRGLFRAVWSKRGGIFKVSFMDKICLDLFPWDAYYKRMETNEEIDIFKREYIDAMNTARRAEERLFDIACSKKLQIKFNEIERLDYSKICREMLLHNNAPDYEHGDIFEGIDWQLRNERIMGIYHNSVWRNEYILPYSQIEFCGHIFSAPNNPDAWLTTRYGDWRAFRPDFARHTPVAFGYDELPIVEQFITGNIA